MELIIEPNIEARKNFPRLCVSVCLSVSVCLFSAIPMAYGSFQARGLIGAAAASLCQTHSNAGSEPRLQPTPQLTAVLDP